MFKSKKRSGTRGPYDSERTLISTIVSNDEFYILDLSKYMGKYDSKLKYRIRLWGVGSSKQNLNSLVCKFDVYGE